MSKIGKTLNTMTEATVRASGVVTKNTGEALSGLGKKMGIDKGKCNRMEQSAENMGKDMYYAGSKAGKNVEKATDKLIDKSKEMMHKMNSK